MLAKLSRWSHFTFIELADPRTNSWPLMQSPWPVFTLIGIYFWFVLSLGPKLMANRQPFQLKNILIGYNAVQVLFNLALIWPAIGYAYVFGDYSFKCQPVGRGRDPNSMKIALYCYFYFLAKIFELMDTIFFVLRKKDNQISFLHVVHHSGMCLLSWGTAKYFPGGQFVFGGTLNCVVHVIMYSYYLLSALGPKYKKYLWWKKYITKIQLTQFVVCALHFSQVLIYDCGFPRWICFVTLPNGFFMFDMFSDFYKQAYNKKLKEKQEKDALDKNGNCLTNETKPEGDKKKVN